MPNWLLYALIAAFSASLINILGKVGMEGIDSNLATGIRSVVMAVFLVGVCTVLGLWSKLPTVSGKALGMIVLSGIAGAVSWLFVFRAIQIGDVSKVAPIDKLSMPLGIILAVIIFRERPSLLNWVGIFLIAGGAYLAAWPKAKAPAASAEVSATAPAATQESSHKDAETHSAGTGTGG